MFSRVGKSQETSISNTPDGLRRLVEGRKQDAPPTPRLPHPLQAGLPQAREADADLAQANFTYSEQSINDCLRKLGVRQDVLDLFKLKPSQLMGLRRIGPKPGGSPDKSSLGGVYANADGAKLLLKTGKPEHVFAEFLGSALNASINPGAVQVPLLRLGDQTYLASFFFEDCMDLYRYAFESLGLAAPAKRPVVHVGNAETTAIIDRAFLQCKDIQLLLALCLLLGNLDVHSGNFVVLVERVDGRPVLVAVRLIDLGWTNRDSKLLGLRVGDNFGPEIRPHAQRPPVVGPTNHLIDIPEQLRSGEAYIDALLKAARHDYRPAAAIAFEQAAQHWDGGMLRAFARNAGLDVPRGADAQAVKQAYIERLQRRQQSMLRYAADLAVGCASVADGYLAPDEDAYGRPLVDKYLGNVDLAAHIGAYARGEPGGAKLRNHALDGCEDALRQMLLDRIAHAAVRPPGGPLTRK